MQNADKILRALFDSGTDPRIREDIRRWFFAGSGRVRKDDALRKLWEEQVKPRSVADPQTIERYAALCKRLGLPVPETRNTRIHTVRRRFLYRVTTAAAVLAVGIVCATLLHTGLLTDRRAVVRTEQSHAGQSPREITLACGSSVWLRGESRIGISRSQREVTLRGEACFTVEPNGTPFVVHAGQIDVKVLGTVFCVSEAEYLDRMTVDLYSGAVELKTGADRIALEKGNRFVMDKKSGRWRIEPMTHNIGYPHWVQSAMTSADGIAFDDILQIVSSAYGLETINNRPDLGDDKYYFTLTEEMQIGDAMNTLRLLNPDFTYRIEDNKLIID